MLNILVADAKNEITQDVNLALNTNEQDCKIKATRSGNDCLNTME